MKTSNHKMNAKTLEALKGSIQKWKDIVAGEGEDKGSDNCPLCQLFFKNGCRKCPVNTSTEWICCELTPYEAWEEHQFQNHYDELSKVNCPECLKLAKAELKFLKSLLPK